MPWGFAGAAVATIGSSIIGANAAQSAADTQAAAAQQASQNSLNMFNTIKGQFAPYLSYGNQGVANAEAMLPSLLKPFNPTMADLSATPGYQFTLQQGEQAVNNGLSAQGLAGNNPQTAFSGAQQKAASQYAENLASTTYQQQFQNYLTQNQQLYGMLQGQIGTGLGAAGQTGQFGTTATQQANQYLTGGAAAQAAGTVGAANAYGGALNSIGGYGAVYGLNNIFGPTKSPTGGASSATASASPSYLTQAYNYLFPNVSGGTPGYGVSPSA